MKPVTQTEHNMLETGLKLHQIVQMFTILCVLWKCECKCNPNHTEDQLMEFTFDVPMQNN